MTPRPFLFSPLFFLILNFYLLKHSPSRSDYIIIPLIICLWSNIHGAYIFLVIIFAIVIALHFIMDYNQQKTYHNKYWIYITFTSILFSFVNPHPISLIKRIFTAGNYPTSDWYSLTWWLINKPITILPILLIYALTLYLFYFTYIKNKLEIRVYTSAIFISSIICLIFPIKYIRLSWLLIIPLINSIYLLSIHGLIRKYVPKEKKYASFQ